MFLLKGQKKRRGGGARLLSIKILCYFVKRKNKGGRGLVCFPVLELLRVKCVILLKGQNKKGGEGRLCFPLQILCSFVKREEKKGERGAGLLSSSDIVLSCQKGEKKGGGGGAGLLSCSDIVLKGGGVITSATF